MDEQIEISLSQDPRTVGDLLEYLKKYDPGTPITMNRMDSETAMNREIDWRAAEIRTCGKRIALAQEVYRHLVVFPDLMSVKQSPATPERPFKVVTISTMILAIHDEGPCKFPENG